MLKVSCALTQHFSKFRPVCGFEWKKNALWFAAAEMSEGGIGRRSFVVFFFVDFFFFKPRLLPLHFRVK